MRHDFLEIHASDPHGCLARAKAQLIDGLDTEGQPAKVGTTVHRVAQAIAIERAERPAVDIFEVVQRVVREQAIVLRMSAGGVVDAFSILEKVLDFKSRISLWVEAGWNGKPERRWGLVEDGDDFAFIENPTEPCFAAGAIDMDEWVVDGRRGRVTDYKSSLQMFSSADAYESFQIRLYVFAVMRDRRDMLNVEGRFAMLRHGYHASADFARGDPWETGTIMRVRAEREVRQRALETGEFPETPGPWCSYCPVLLKCSAVRKYAEMGAEAIGDLSPSEAARAWLGLKALGSKLEKFVRAHVEAEGEPIALGDPHGTMLGFKQTNGIETVASYEDTMELLRSYGMGEDVFAANFRFVAPHHFASRVKKVAREDLGVDAETMDRLVIPVSKSEFTTYVPEVEIRTSEPVAPDELDALLAGSSAERLKRALDEMGR